MIRTRELGDSQCIRRRETAHVPVDEATHSIKMPLEDLKTLHCEQVTLWRSRSLVSRQIAISVLRSGYLPSRVRAEPVFSDEL